ncbi:MAG: P83/100 family protein [Termitinemataceae bacterium]|nr:MAG: P83/100 family protein [Termitinemataceae bacterium]
MPYIISMKQNYAALFCLLILFSSEAFAQDAVDSSELRNNLGTIEFIDNASPTSGNQFNTRAQIIGIGSALGSAARGGTQNAGDTSRYFIIHRLHPAEFDKLDGDIFGLGSASSVDTIRNLRWIIQGYLTSAYNYSDTDAILLAEYITIYNAVYRKNRTYFSGRYKTPLLNDLTNGIEGLAVRYNEWPGQTMMLIPLQTALDGSLSAVDTTAITEQAVIDEMRKDAGRGIDSRQDMVDLKEREAEAASAKAAEQRAAADAEDKRIQAERERISGERAELQKTQNSEAATDAERSEAAERSKELAAEEAALDKSQEAADEQREAAEASENLAQRKMEEADADRDAIADDQRELIAQGSVPVNAPATPTGVLGIKLSNKASLSGSPVQVNPKSSQVMKTSGLNAVRARTLMQVGGKTLAIAGEQGEKSTHRLIEIDPVMLTMIKKGNDEVSSESLIWANGNSIYAIVVSGGKNYLGRFGDNLDLQSQSQTVIHPFASVYFSDGRLLTQDATGSVVSLDADTLQP